MAHLGANNTNKSGNGAESSNRNNNQGHLEYVLATTPQIKDLPKDNKQWHSIPPPSLLPRCQQDHMLETCQNAPSVAFITKESAGKCTARTVMKKGHTINFCRVPAQQTNQNTKAGMSRTCYRCGEVGNFIKEFSETKNKDFRSVGSVLATERGKAVIDPAEIPVRSFPIAHMHGYYIIATRRGVLWVVDLINFSTKNLKNLNEIFTVELE